MYRLSCDATRGQHRLRKCNVWWTLGEKCWGVPWANDTISGSRRSSQWLFHWEKVLCHYFFSTLPHSISKYTVTLRRLSFLRALSPSSPVPRSHSLPSPPGRHTRSQSGTAAVGSFCSHVAGETHWLEPLVHLRNSCCDAGMRGTLASVFSCCLPKCLVCVLYWWTEGNSC